jgi:hypothetical protein
MTDCFGRGDRQTDKDMPAERKAVGKACRQPVRQLGIQVVRQEGRQTD